MLFFDLKLLLFGLLLSWCVVAAGAVWVERWLGRRGRKGLVVDGVMVSPLLEGLPFGLLVLDGARTYRYANPYARRLFELSLPSGALPDTVWSDLLEEDRQATSEEQGEGSYRSVPLQGEQWIRWWVTPWDKWEVVVFQDATAERRGEQNAHLMISNLSHELRTPLATLLTHLEILKLPQIREHTRQQSLELMGGETKRMSRLVRHLIDLSRLETSAELERRPLDLLSLVESVIAQLIPQAEAKQMALSLQVDGLLAPVLGDPDRLKQLFLNLIENAIKYSRPSDSITVSLSPQPEGILCTICDSGPGIPAEHLPHITTRFYRVNHANHKSVAGNGLGLALVVEILRRHQTRLQIESRNQGETTGTTVRFQLPTLPALSSVISNQ